MVPLTQPGSTVACVVAAGGLEWPLWLGIVLSGVGTAAVFCLAVLTYRRRRARPHLFVALALGVLALRPLLGAGTALGVVPMGLHHPVEHLLDLGIVGLLVGAVLSVRSLQGPAAGQAGEEAAVEPTEVSR